MKFCNSTSDLGNPLTLSGCRELKELEIHASRPGIAESDLISSITSTNIRRITFTQPISPHDTWMSDHLNWARLDNSLCRLVDRLGSGHRLEVEFLAFNARLWWGGDLGFKKYLPRFHEKGGGRGK